MISHMQHCYCIGASMAMKFACMHHVWCSLNSIVLHSDCLNRKSNRADIMLLHRLDKRTKVRWYQKQTIPSRWHAVQTRPLKIVWISKEVRFMFSIFIRENIFTEWRRKLQGRKLAKAEFMQGTEAIYVDSAIDPFVNWKIKRLLLTGKFGTRL